MGHLEMIGVNTDEQYQEECDLSHSKGIECLYL